MFKSEKSHVSTAGFLWLPCVPLVLAGSRLVPSGPDKPRWLPYAPAGSHTLPLAAASLADLVGCR